MGVRINFDGYQQMQDQIRIRKTWIQALSTRCVENWKKYLSVRHFVIYTCSSLDVSKDFNEFWIKMSFLTEGFENFSNKIWFFDYVNIFLSLKCVLYLSEFYACISIAQKPWNFICFLRHISFNEFLFNINSNKLYRYLYDPSIFVAIKGLIPWLRLKVSYTLHFQVFVF